MEWRIGNAVTFVEWSGPLPAAAELGRVHLVGVGGAGMSGLARLLAAQGVQVSGCDAKESPALPPLRALGLTVEVGHAAEHADLADTVVVSSAIRSDNPDLTGAQERNRRILPRAVGLSAAMAGKRGIAVAGTHGKTTTTSMLTVALQASGGDPSYAIGADLNEPGSNAHHGSGEFFVAEADESDRSFLVLRRELAIVTNVEADHLDNYGSFDAVLAAFEEFVGGLPSDGVALVGADDPHADRLATVARGVGARAVGFGFDHGDVRIDRLVLEGSGSSFDLVEGGRRLGTVRLAVPGRHNASDAAAALAAGLALGLPFADMVRGLAGFTGARRRFEPRGAVGGVRVYDDYSHHPTEVRAALDAARVVAGGGRVVAVFQPHLFSRTERFAEEFGRALGTADAVVVMDVFAAREDPIPGITGHLIADAVPLPPGQVRFQPSWSAVARDVADLVRPGDVVLTIGAGDVTMLAPALVDALSARIGGAR